MSNINEEKKAFLETNNIRVGTIAWRTYLDSQGFAGNSIVEDTKALLMDGGYWTGNMPESLRGFYVDNT